MKAIIYVEGSSDKLALEALLNPLIEQKLQEGVTIEIFETPEGDRKASLLTKVPHKAINILMNDPTAVVAAVPDLYPKNKGFPHETYQDLVRGLTSRFEQACQKKGHQPDERINRRFKVFCFKHDLEVLILAAEESLCAQLGVASLGVSWRKPVEDQNQDHPPKYVVEEIYRRHGQKYKGTVDAPLIFRGVSYHQIAERCPQCFGPFVEFLENLQDV